MKIGKLAGEINKKSGYSIQFFLLGEREMIMQCKKHDWERGRLYTYHVAGQVKQPQPYWRANDCVRGLTRKATCTYAGLGMDMV